MKKQSIILTLALLCMARAGAQDSNNALSLKSKKGVEILPQEGDWSFGISASPFLNYAGNLLNGNTYNNSPNFSSPNLPYNDVFDNIGGLTFLGKYVKRQDLFYRTRFNLNSYRQTNQYSVEKDKQLPDVFTVEYVTDKQIYRNTSMLLGLGFEKRKGSGRLQGYYGAEALFGFARSSSKYEYGNPMNLEFPTPRTYNNGFALSRILENNSGHSFAFGGRGFIGVEYFIAPRMSLGGEIGYTIGVQTNSKSNAVYERFNPETLQAERIVNNSYRNGGTTYTGMGLDNSSGSIVLYFYF